MLDDIKIFLGIQLEDATKDDLLNLYIKRAIYTVKMYLNKDDITDSEITRLYSEAVVSLVVDAQRLEASGTVGIKSMSQGARSVTYADEKSFTITSSIKGLLPLPYLKMR